MNFDVAAFRVYGIVKQFPDNRSGAFDYLTGGYPLSIDIPKDVDPSGYLIIRSGFGSQNSPTDVPGAAGCYQDRQ